MGNIIQKQLVECCCNNSRYSQEYFVEPSDSLSRNALKTAYQRVSSRSHSQSLNEQTRNSIGYVTTDAILAVRGVSYPNLEHFMICPFIRRGDRKQVKRIIQHLISGEEIEDYSDSEDSNSGLDSDEFEEHGKHQRLENHERRYYGDRQSQSKKSKLSYVTPNQEDDQELCELAFETIFNYKSVKKKLTNHRNFWQRIRATVLVCVETKVRRRISTIDLKTELKNVSKSKDLVLQLPEDGIDDKLRTEKSSSVSSSTTDSSNSSSASNSPNSIDHLSSTSSNTSLGTEELKIPSPINANIETKIHEEKSEQIPDFIQDKVISTLCTTDFEQNITAFAAMSLLPRVERFYSSEASVKSLKNHTLHNYIIAPTTSWIPLGTLYTFQTIIASLQDKISSLMPSLLMVAVCLVPYAVTVVFPPCCVTFQRKHSECISDYFKRLLGYASTYVDPKFRKEVQKTIQDSSAQSQAYPIFLIPYYTMSASISPRTKQVVVRSPTIWKQRIGDYNNEIEQEISEIRHGNRIGLRGHAFKMIARNHGLFDLSYSMYGEFYLKALCRHVLGMEFKKLEIEIESEIQRDQINVMNEIHVYKLAEQFMTKDSNVKIESYRKENWKEIDIETLSLEIKIASTQLHWDETEPTFLKRLIIIKDYCKRNAHQLTDLNWDEFFDSFLPGIQVILMALCNSMSRSNSILNDPFLSLTWFTNLTEFIQQNLFDTNLGRNYFSLNIITVSKKLIEIFWIMNRLLKILDALAFSKSNLNSKYNLKTMWRVLFVKHIYPKCLQNLLTTQANGIMQAESLNCLWLAEQSELFIENELRIITREIVTGWFITKSDDNRLVVCSRVNALLQILSD